MKGFETLLSKRRHQYQDWNGNPPHKFGFIIFFSVIAELILVKSLYNEQGIDLQIIGRIIGGMILLFIFEGVIVKVADETASFFQKKGNWKTALTFLNIGLYPLLLYLPIALVCWVAGIDPDFKLILFILLILKVIGNWKESLEIAYEFNKLQSILVIYSAITAIIVIIVIGIYISFFRSASNFLSIG